MYLYALKNCFTNLINLLDYLKYLTNKLVPKIFNTCKYLKIIHRYIKSQSVYNF